MGLKKEYKLLILQIFIGMTGEKRTETRMECVVHSNNCNNAECTQLDLMHDDLCIKTRYNVKIKCTRTWYKEK